MTDRLKKGADPNIHNDFGKTPLHSLISRQYKDKKLKADLLYAFLTESVKELEVNLSSTKDGNTALHLAVQVRIIITFIGSSQLILQRLGDTEALRDMVAFVSFGS